MADFAILGQDPGYAGGVLSQTTALHHAATALGREPELYFLRYRRLDGLRGGAALAGSGVNPVLPGIDLVNVTAAAVLLARRTRRMPVRFVCAATAASGLGATLAGGPFGCWIGTTLADEQPSRRRGLGASRRIAQTASAPGLRAIERATLRRARVLWTTSAASARAVAEAADLDEARLRTVAIPIDGERFAPLDDALWQEQLNRPVLIFVGRGDDPRKNVQLLLDGFARLRARIPDARLRLVGSTPPGRLPDGAEATGRLPSITEALRHASLFVLPSRQEGFGIVVAEALAAGVPVLVTPCGGPEELVHASEGGEVLPSFDPDALADRAFDLLNDPQRLMEMRRRGRAYVLREHDPARLRAALEEALAILDER